jgi:hypothetical protein
VSLSESACRSSRNYSFVILRGMSMVTVGRTRANRKNPSRIRQYRETVVAATDEEGGMPSPLTADEANLLAGGKSFGKLSVGFAGAARPAHVCHCQRNLSPQLPSPEQGISDNPWHGAFSISFCRATIAGKKAPPTTMGQVSPKSVKRRRDPFSKVTSA